MVIASGLMLSYNRAGRAQLAGKLWGELKYSLGRKIQWTSKAGSRACLLCEDQGRDWGRRDESWDSLHVRSWRVQLVE